MSSTLHNNQPKYMTISSSIIDSIENGKFAPGDVLPSIRDLAEKYHTSNSTVQRALYELESKGYIETLPGKGSRISYTQGETIDASPIWKVFWSYAHQDDKLDRGRITQLREDIQSEYLMQTGDELNIFQDTKDIKWGMDWRSTIKNNLGVTTFFIPVLTPTYLRRPHCLGELKAAIQQFRDLGLSEGVFPIEYIDIERQLAELRDNDVATFLSSCQRIQDWKALRFEDRGSSEYRKGVKNIVDTLIKKDEEMKETFISLQLHTSESDEKCNSDENIDLLEQIISIEDNSKELVSCIKEINSIFNEIGHTFSNRNLSKATSPKGMVAAITQIGAELEPHSIRLQEQDAQYQNAIKALDRGVSASIELLRYTNSDTEANKMYASVSALQEAASKSFSQIDETISTLRMLESISQKLRKPCKAIRATIEDIVASSNYFDRWKNELEKILAEKTHSCPNS